ncbi:MAG TPA: FG-GAP-like repeat-containing protein [Candidatus Binatia bacterium]
MALAFALPRRADAILPNVLTADVPENCGEGSFAVVYPLFFGLSALVVLTKDGKVVDSVFVNEPPQSAIDEVCKNIVKGGGVPHSADRGRLAAAVALKPVDAAVGDFNGDGRSDLAVVNQDSNNVSVFLANPDGTFGPPVLFPTGNGPQHIKSGDFNKDGKFDLVTANSGGDVSLLLAKADGTFQAPIPIFIGAGTPADVAVGDFDKDTNLDLAVADSSAHVVVLLGDGHDTFGSPTTFNVNPNFLLSLVVDDMNGDTNPDIITPGSILLGNGDGGFPTAIEFPAGGLGGNPLTVRTGDVNGDHKPDVVVLSGGNHMVSIFLGKGDGTLLPPHRYVTGNKPTEVSIVDLDSDGKTDLLVTNINDDHLAMFFGNGDGTFQGSPAYFTDSNPSGFGGFDAAVANFTSDNVPDVVVANGGDAALLTGLGGGAFGAPTMISGLSNVSRVIAGDWNGDSKQDIAFTNGSNLAVALGKGDGTFQTPTTPGTGSFDFLTSAFVNNDTIPDLLVANTGANNISVFLGNVQGGFTPAPQPTLSVGTFPNGIATGDFNKDGKLDLAISNRGASDDTNGSVQIALGNGDGTFQTPVTIQSNVQPDSVVVADFNGDNKLDIAAVVQSPLNDWEIEVYLQNDNGTFPQTPLKLGVTQDLVKNLRVADFDHDNIPDLVVSMEGTKGAFYRGVGDGTFEAPLIVDLGGDARIVVADLDQDSLPDVVAPAAGTVGSMAVLINISDQQPVDAINLSVSPSPLAFGNVAVGQFADLPLTITSQAASTQTLTGSVGTLSAPFSIQSGGGSINLTPGQSQIVTIRFAPTAAGPSSTNLSITHNATNRTSPTDVMLSGAGLAAAGPNLVVSALSGPSAALLKGKLALSYTVQNQGNANAASFNVGFYLSSDNVITSQDTLLASSKALKNGLAGGGSTGATSQSITLPKTTAPGSYFIGAIADPGNKVSETSESDNTKSFPITVCAPMTAPSLQSPAKGATVSTTPALNWSDVNGASTYEVQLATDSKFKNIVQTQTGLATSDWTVAPALASGATLYWHVRAVSPCGPGSFSKALSFKTN